MLALATIKYGWDSLHKGDNWLGRSDVDYDETQTLHGNLRFAAQVVERGVVFCNPLTAIITITMYEP